MFFSENVIDGHGGGALWPVEMLSCPGWGGADAELRKMLYLCRREDCADNHITIQGIHGYQPAGCAVCAPGGLSEP